MQRERNVGLCRAAHKHSKHKSGVHPGISKILGESTGRRIII